MEAARKEYHNAKLVAAFSFDQPKVYDFVTICSRNGIIYEKLQGITLLEWVIQNKDAEQCGKIMAEEHKKIFLNRIQGVQRIKDIYRFNIENAAVIQKDWKYKLLELINKLPEGDTLCHGDFHPGNLMLQGNRKIIIDWMNVCSGYLYSDIARTIYLTEMTPVPIELPDAEKFNRFRRLIGSAYLKHMEIRREELDSWLVVMQQHEYRRAARRKRKIYLLI